MNNVVNESLIVSPGVRWMSDKDGSTILHITQNKMYSIMGVGNEVWKIVANSESGITYSDIVQAVADRFNDISRIRIHDDVEKLLKSFLREQLVAATHNTRAGEVRRNYVTTSIIAFLAHGCGLLVRLKLSVVAALLGMAVVDLLIASGKFEALYYTIKYWPVRQITEVPAFENVYDSMLSALSWYPKQAMCLQRSAVTTCLLRSNGICAEMIIGSKKLPFLAHAWVEVNGQVVGDKKSVQELHAVLDRW